MVNLIPESHKNHIWGAVRRYFDLYKDDGLETRLERFFRKYSEVNNLPYESVREFGQIVLEELAEEESNVEDEKYRQASLRRGDLRSQQAEDTGLPQANPD